MYSEGHIYEGDFLKGMKHGVGILKFKHQEYYKGEFMWDQYDGKGSYVFNSGD